MPTKALQIPTTDGQANAFVAFPDHDDGRLRHPWSQRGVLLGGTWRSRDLWRGAHGLDERVGA